MSAPPPEPNKHAGDRPAVLLVNLGSPEAPTAKAVRSYLREFLSDPRVVELPRFLWPPLLHGVVLTVRPRVSAKKYAAIWARDGSPLITHSRKQAVLLTGTLGNSGTLVRVEAAMRYGQPALRDALERLRASGHGRILILPLYPQYSASTTASTIDEVARYLRRTRDIPEIRIVKHFHDHPAYIAAVAASVRKHWQDNGRPDRLLVSFHGLPKAMVKRGDPYLTQCNATAGLLANELELAEDRWAISFQSRFGRTEWLGPATATTLAEWGRKRLGRVDVVCPGFVADCLETLEEIGIEGKQTYLSAGGGQFHLIECLNESNAWIEALAAIARAHLSGWVNAGCR